MHTQQPQRHPPISDTLAMDLIAATLNGREWTPETMDTVAHLIRSTGRVIADHEADA